MLRKGCYGLLVVLLLWGTSSVNAKGDRGTVKHDGLERTYYLYVPSSYSEDGAVPLVVVLHPYASSGRAIAALTGFDEVAEEQGFIAVYPESTDFRWNDGLWNYAAIPGVEAPDDVGFIQAMIDQVSAEYEIDQVYLTGFANGGVMAYRLGCEIPQRFTRIAIVGATMWEEQLDACPTDTGAVSMLIVTGEQDTLYPPQGRRIPGDEDEPELRILSTEDTLAFWAERNGCDLQAATTLEIPRATIYESCADDTSTALYTMVGVGNNWPRTGDQYHLNQFGIDMTAVVTQYFIGDPDWAALVPPTVVGDDIFSATPRSYVIYVPPTYDSDQPTPLVIGLHGRPGSGLGYAYLSDFNRVAREYGFIVAYPDGLNREWNYPRGTEGYQIEVDDVAFLNALVDDLSINLNIDPQKVYVTGFSNGGFMTQRVACEAGDRYAGYAVVGATLFPDFITLCEETPPVPIMFMHGTADVSIPWEGTAYGDAVLSLSVPDTVIFWALHNGCDPNEIEYEILPKQDENASTVVYRYAFGGCAEDADMLYYVIENGGHNLPGVADRLEPAIAGEVNMDILAAEEIWKFFSAHERPETE